MLRAIEILIHLALACLQFGFHFLKMLKLTNLPEGQEEGSPLRESVSQPSALLCLFQCYPLTVPPKVRGQRPKCAVVKRSRFYIFV